MPKVFAICGHAGSGKDTLADIVVQKWGPSFTIYRLAFADPLRRAGCELLYKNMSIFTERCSKDSPLSSSTSCTPRDVLKSLGDWARNNVGQGVFADIMCSKISDIFKNDQNAIVLVTDLRMPQELSALNIEFGNDLVLVCVDADLRIGFDPSSAHETESHVTQIHKSPLISSKVYIQNNTTLSDFRQRIYDSIGIHMP